MWVFLGEVLYGSWDFCFVLRDPNPSSLFILSREDLHLPVFDFLWGEQWEVSQIGFDAVGIFLLHGQTYVAGDRVVLDPFCKPFSMGRYRLWILDLRSFIRQGYVTSHLGSSVHNGYDQFMIYFDAIML